MLHPTLYKKSTTGVVLVWSQEREGGKYRTIAGQQDGQHVTSAWTNCEGKNIGRSNETTPEQQAELEVAANYTKKLAQGGYHDSINDIDKKKFYAMLAYPMEKYPLTGIAFEKGLVQGQAKLDGIRCIHGEDGPFSRKGKPIFTVPHISEILSDFLRDSHMFDGELYNHELKRDFNKITSLVKKTKPTTADLAESANLVQYHVYDLPSHAGGFEERSEALRKIVAEINHPSLVFVETVPMVNHEAMIAYFERCMADGYEGGIVRINGKPYENKRSKNLLKYKAFVDAEFKILDIEQGQGNWEGAAKGVWFAMPDGSRFKATMMGTREYCTEVYQNRDAYVGREATVKYSKDLTPAGIPRWGSVKTIHEGKRHL